MLGVFENIALKGGLCWKTHSFMHDKMSTEWNMDITISWGIIVYIGVCVCVCVGKTCFVSHTKYTQWKINGSSSFAIDNMYYVNFRIQVQESIPWCD